MRYAALQGVALGLVLGKPIVIMRATVLLMKLTKVNLDPTVSGWTCSR